MTSDEQRIQTLLELLGLRLDDNVELTSLANDYPLMRAQVDEMHRSAFDGLARDISVPRRFSAGSASTPSLRGTALTIEAAAAALRDGTVSALGLVTDVFARIDRLDSTLGAYVSTFRQTALEAAEHADRELAAGHDRGLLHGIPLNIKDVISTVEGPTRANSLVEPPQWHGDRDAAVVARLREAGAVIIGKTTTNEFALAPNDPVKGFPMPRNAWSADRYAGGSSSGAAIAVASGMALGAVATDTSGSIRHPSALNGVTGLKVTSGRVPTSGVIPLSPSQDTVGPIARSARDCALLLQVMAGFDAADPESSRLAVPSYLDAMDGVAHGVRIGWPKRYFFDEDNVSDPVRLGVIAAIERLRDAGATVSEVEISHADMARTASIVVLLAEALAYHRDALASHGADYGVYTRGLLARGVIYSAADYVQAMKIGAMLRREVSEVMRDCDVLIVPTMPTGARLLNETDPTMMDRWSSASFMAQWNLSGFPSCAVPVGCDGLGMPVSMQVIGRPFDELTVLRVADAYQRLTDFHLALPDPPDDRDSTLPTGA